MKLSKLMIAVIVFAAAVAGCGKDAAAEGSSADACLTPIPLPVAEQVAIPDSPTFARMVARGHATVGIKVDQPGLAYKTAGNDRCGFDVDIARLISAGLGLAPEAIDYREIPTANREASIRSGEIDYYVGSYSINDKRKQQVSFAGPYLQTGQGMLVRSDETHVTGKDSLWGKKVCSTTGTTSIQRIKDQHLTQPENIIEFKVGSECLSQMMDGNVDVLTTDEAILAGYASAVPGHFKLVGELLSVERYGVGLARTDAALRNAMNDILERAAHDGTWQRLFDASLGPSGLSATPPAVDRY
jgi:glutamate transport system substrate-binding protein